jgi:NAD(P)-dependent dehydrogenase (short-subunit alcohol dehydrogenase family)
MAEAAPHFSLAGKVVLLTEAQPADGLGLPALLARAGADLALTAPDTDLLAGTVAAIEGLGRTCRAYRLDFHDLASIRAAIDAVLADFSRLDVLVNNVGYNVPSWALDVTPEEWAAVVQMNLSGPFFCAQAAGRAMVKAGRGRIINVGTHTAVKTNVRRTAYGAARAGMAQFTRNLALEWAPNGVTVNSVAPTYVKPDTLSAHPAMYEDLRRHIPMRRFATEAEVAAAIIFLASDAAAYITGQTLVVDGGTSL